MIQDHLKGDLFSKTIQLLSFFSEIRKSRRDRLIRSKRMRLESSGDGNDDDITVDQVGIVNICFLILSTCNCTCHLVDDCLLKACYENDRLNRVKKDRL